MADQDLERQSKRRLATVYDAVAGRVGPNGFLTPEQLQSSSINPYTPEEVLLRSINAPENVSNDFYDADERLKPGQKLPDSDLTKAIHAYASDFYDMATATKGQHDFKSLDETALLAMGILLEEAAREILGETGDMALVEPAGLEYGLPESKRTNHQIKGRVKPAPTPEDSSDASPSEGLRPKKRKVTGRGKLT